MTTKNTYALWERVYQTGSWSNDFPTQNALAFYEYHLADLAVTGGPNLKLLDMGCGSGANSVYFGQMGLDVTGLDFSKLAIEKFNDRKTNVNFPIAGLEGRFNSLPFDNAQFSAVFSEGSMYYGDRQDFIDAVDEIYRVLKPGTTGPGGVARIFTKSDKDMYAKTENLVSEEAYRVKRSGHWEDGMLIFCPTQKTIEEIFSKFKVVNLGFSEFNYVGLEECHAFWVITCYK